MSTPDSSGANYDVWRVSPEAVSVIWQQIEPLIEQYGQDTILNFWTLDEIKEGAKGDKLELWIGMDGSEIQHVGITQVCGGQRGIYVEVIWVGGAGALRHVRKALKKLEQWAAVVGAKRLMIGGREGWTRVLAPLGYGFHRVEMTKEISFVRDDNNEPQWRN